MGWCASGGGLKGKGVPTRMVPGSCAVLSILSMVCTPGAFARATGENSSRPQIRIAHLVTDMWPSAPIRYMMKYFDVNRTILPDYDIIIDEFHFRPSEASVCFIFPCRGAVEDVLETFLGIVGDDTPTYHAITGPFMPEEVKPDLVKLAAKARILQIHGSNQPVLSDRTQYPYSFRATWSLQGNQMTMFHIAAENGWRDIVSIWWAEDLWANSNEIALKMNITNHATLADAGAASWAVDAWQTDVMNFIRSSRIRVLIAYTSENTGWQLICRIYRDQLLGLQIFIDERWVFRWYALPHHPSLGDCSAQEMTDAVQGYLRIYHTRMAAGVPLPGNHIFNEVAGGVTSHLPLTCMPGATADMFFGIEQIVMAAEEGFITDFSDTDRMSFYLGLNGMTTDAVCAALLGLHDAIYGKNISAEGIAEREASSFRELTASVSEVDFQSPIGRFSFYSNTGDPQYLYFAISQEAIPGRETTDLEFNNNIGAATFPNGQEEPPLITIFNESKSFMWRDGSTGLGPRPHLGLFPECGSINSTLVWDKCQPCAAGTYYDSLLRDCRTCPYGEFQNETGMASCETAALGWYVTDVEAPSTIAKCPAGHKCPQRGTVLPEPCTAGRFASADGQSACELCPAGRYQDGPNATGCKSCQEVLDGGVTATIASTSPDQCICPTRSYRALDSDSCSQCSKGMVCPQGSDMRNLVAHSSSWTDASAQPPAFPHARRGYMTKVGEPLTVYRCAEEEHCPGGPPGTCASRRDASAVACGDCLSGYYEEGAECGECGTNGAWPLVMTCVAGIAGAVTLTVVINKDLHKTPASSLMIVAVAGLLIMSFQTMGVFSSLDIPWEEPAESILNMAAVISFDLELLKVACIMGVNPLRSFAFRQLLPVLLVPVVLITLLVKKNTPKCGKPSTQIRIELYNSLGTFFSVFFISILISALDPFICYEHPGDAGESVRSAPSLLCFEGEQHTAMIIIGIVAVSLVPLPFMSSCLYAVLMYPKKLKLHSSGKFLLATRFLFFRYVPQRYYFHLIILLRSFLICTIPALFRGQLATQVLFISFVLGAYVVIVAVLQPWRVHLCNIVDAAMIQSLVAVVLCGALFIPETPQKEVVVLLTVGVIGWVVFGTAIAIAYGLWRRLAPSCYHYFLCHHKAHAAAQSRYLKMLLLKKRGNIHVFIDSDDLQELDKLFDIVKSQVRHLVVLLTADTLKRPWCTGEIVTALRMRLSITRLHSSSFLGLSEEQRANPESYVDSTGCNLSEYNIQWSDVACAYAEFLSSSVPELHLNKDLPGTQRLDAAADALLSQHAVTVKEGRAKMSSELPAGGVLIVTDPENDEASATSGILLEHIGPDVYRTYEHGIYSLSDFAWNSTEVGVHAALRASVDILVLSSGCLESLKFLSIVCEVMYAQEIANARPAVISVNTPGFQFLAPAVVEKLCAEAFPQLVPKASVSPPADYVNAFFKRISILYPTHASHHALVAQSQEIFSRITAATNKITLAKGALGESSSSSTRMVFATGTATSGGETVQGESSLSSKIGPGVLPLSEARSSGAADLGNSPWRADVKISGGFPWHLDL